MSTTPDIEIAFKLSLKLSRLSVGDDKRAQLSADLGNILTYINSIEAVDTEQTVPLLSPLQLSDHARAPLRDDMVNEQEAPLARAFATGAATNATTGASDCDDATTNVASSTTSSANATTDDADVTDADVTDGDADGGGGLYIVPQIISQDD
ncbi:MAG: aspartyl/glutamyl-tRNA amidotransferase subunit C [Proteobacteria bacterium]|nr:aspartyl/glutamyl-tRNA amidotransferase subunit C [Pseudomonadota bacterium]